MKRSAILLACIVAAACSAEERVAGNRDGQVTAQADGGFVAWDARQAAWLDPEAFWQSYASAQGDRNWPSGAEYPPYEEVQEHDTFLVKTDHGPCLMYFFHTRWRRANDVRRWGDEFNDYGGCPYVFD